MPHPHHTIHIHRLCMTRGNMYGNFPMTQKPLHDNKQKKPSLSLSLCILKLYITRTSNMFNRIIFNVDKDKLFICELYICSIATSYRIQMTKWIQIYFLPLRKIYFKHKRKYCVQIIKTQYTPCVSY